MIKCEVSKSFTFPKTTLHEILLAEARKTEIEFNTKEIEVFYFENKVVLRVTYDE